MSRNARETNQFTHKLKQIGFVVNDLDQIDECQVDQMLEFITEKYTRALTGFKQEQEDHFKTK